MKKSTMPLTFSGFAWGLAGFCLPVLLWPLALLISPNLLKNPLLTDSQITFMSVFLWSYPLILALVARLTYHLHKTKPNLAVSLLSISAVIFYGILIYISMIGFGQ